MTEKLKYTMVYYYPTVTPYLIDISTHLHTLSGIGAGYVLYIWAALQILMAFHKFLTHW